MQKLRTLLKSTGSKILAVAISLILVGTAVFQIIGFFKPADESASYSTNICTETGKSFRHKNQMGEIPPILSPYSGKNTGLKAEACYWTADGSPKTDPTWVLVQKDEPTFCPDCGRLVVGHNPRPAPGMNPPPTKQEYQSRGNR